MHITFSSHYKFFLTTSNFLHTQRLTHSYLLQLQTMATTTYASSSSSSQRSLGMVLALVSAVVLSPLYGNSRSDRRYYESKWSSGGFVLPMLLAGLIIAIRTTSSSVSSSSSTTRASFLPSPEPSWVLRVGSSSWGLGGILVLLMFVLYWQASVQEFFWK